MSGGDWRVLSARQTAPIDQRWFEVVNRSRADAIDAIRSGIPNVRPRPWREERSGLETIFGLTALTHCFDEPPHSWAHLLEPQITRGFVHFLNDGDEKRRAARCLSFVRAALACSRRSSPIPPGWQAAGAVAEAEENRIDILVELTDGRRRFGAAIEAKFGHKLTSGQLEKAENHVTDRKGRQWDAARSAFLVIAPLTQRIDRKLLARRPDWAPVSWWAFLNRLEREITEYDDCRDYRRFRRTVWYRSY